SGSMGEMPPSTRRSLGFTALIASHDALTIAAKIRHPGSISKFQCERLFGSFQSITASTTRRPPFADVDLRLGMRRDLEPGAAQHGLGAGAVGNPPVGGIVRIAVLHKVQHWVSGILVFFGLGK